MFRTTLLLLLVFLVLCTAETNDDLTKYGPTQLFSPLASRIPSKGGRKFKYLNYGQIVAELQRLATLYPGLISIYNAQQRWGVPSPGQCGADGPCRQWIARITNEDTLFQTNGDAGPGDGPPTDDDDNAQGGGSPGQGSTKPTGSAVPTDDLGPPQPGGDGPPQPPSGQPGGQPGGQAPPQPGGEPPHRFRRRRTKGKAAKKTSARPEVFFSGCVHGNERVGPTATVEMARLLLENYKYGNNTWLKMLVDTRSIFIMPSANAIGYYQNKREENGIDPNRDFPYGVDPKKCMRTTAARALNELYREHLFQLALTFHGGMRAISYEWGAPNAKQDYSPDDGVLLPMGIAMRNYASGTSFYPKADAMNPLVYPVKGGMEDWAYASSWDKTPGWVRPCTPTTYMKSGAYPAVKTIYTSDMLKTLNILIETNSAKAPDPTILGSVHQLLMPERAADHSDGDIPRNIRLQLMMIDLVQPYLHWNDQIDNDPKYLQRFWDRIMKDANERGTGSSEHPFIGTEHIEVGWEIGGALTVDDTALFYGYIGGDEPAGGEGGEGGEGDKGDDDKPPDGMTPPAGAHGADGDRPPPNMGDIPQVDCSEGGMMHNIVKYMFQDGNTRSTFTRINVDKDRGHKGTVWYQDPNTHQFKTPGMQMNNVGWSSSPLHSDDDGPSKPFGFGSGYVGDINPTDMKLKANDNNETERVLVVFVVAKVDKNWNTPTRKTWPSGAKPYSHVVNARNSETYTASNGQSKIKGHNYYMSRPLCIVQKMKEWQPNPNPTTTTTSTTHKPTDHSKGHTTTPVPTGFTTTTTAKPPPRDGGGGETTTTSTTTAPTTAPTTSNPSSPSTTAANTPHSNGAKTTAGATTTTTTTTVAMSDAQDQKNAIRSTTGTSTSQSIGTVFLLLLVVVGVTCCCLLILKCANGDNGNDDDGDGGDKNRNKNRNGKSMRHTVSKNFKRVKNKVKTKINKATEEINRKKDIRDSARKSKRQSGMNSEIQKLVAGMSSGDDSLDDESLLREIEMV